MAGLTPTGFVTKTLEEIRAELEAAFREAYGVSLPLGDSTLLGKKIGIHSDKFAEIWEVLESVYSSQDPDEATGDALEALAALTATFRKAAESSTVVLTLTGSDATTVPIASQASTVSTGELFETLAEVTLVELTAWASATAYAVGDRVSNDSNSYVCTVAGTSGGFGGPTGEGDAIVDGTVTWRFMGDGTAVFDVEAQSVNTGEIVAASGDIAEIETPVSGWDGVINLLDADLGNDIESDAELRIRRALEVTQGGTSPADAIITALSGVDGVTSVNLFVNNTNLTDADGLPPQHVEALVTGGEDQDIWDTLLANVAAGIGTFGTETGTSTDSLGNEYTMQFSRPTEIDVWIDIELIKNPDTYPADGDDQVKQAIVTFGDARGAGFDVVSSAIKSACFDVPGVLDVTLAEIGTAPSPSSEATIPIAPREIAKYDTSRITVLSTDGVP